MKRSMLTEERMTAILKLHDSGVSTAGFCQERRISTAMFHMWEALVCATGGEKRALGTRRIKILPDRPDGWRMVGARVRRG